MIFQLALLMGTAPFAVATQQLLFNVNQILTPQLIQFIEGLTINENIPGLTLGIVHSDGQAEYGAWGTKDEDGSLASADTSFSLASCSKAFLSAFMGILMDDFAHGRNVTALLPHEDVFDWNTKVADLLPGEWDLEDDWTTKKANIRDILSHVSGLPRHDYTLHRSDSPKDIFLNRRNLRPAYELREKWSYNNLMYTISSHLISMYAGMPYVDFVKERIFSPLGMSSTTFSPEEATRDYDLTQS